MSQPGFDPNAVHLHYLTTDRVAELRERLLPLLADDERARHDRFVFERGRDEFLATRMLCRFTLSRYMNADPRRWKFRTNAYGRPELDLDPAPLFFNLTNTEGLVACLVGSHADIGVDAEYIHRRGETVKVADRFFSAEEVADLRALPEERQRLRFFEYWTLKEAYIKARGMGLALPLEQFSFRLRDEDPVTVGFGEKIVDDPTSWQFERRCPTETHLVAVAIRAARSPVRIVERFVDPERDWFFPQWRADLRPE